MRILVLFLLTCSTLFAASDEITVQLSSQESLLPIYLAPIQESGSGFDKSYIASLEKVLRFDFDHNGTTETTSSAKCPSKIEADIKQKTLKVKLSTPSGAKGVEGIALTGVLAQDRQTLHKIHDTLFSAAYGLPGIASTRILYTVRSRPTSNATGWVSDVWQADYDGGCPKQLTRESCLIVTPTFVPAPAGSKASSYLYVSYKAGQPKIFAAHLGVSGAEGAGKRLTFLRGNQLMPTISPTLDKIAFISDITGNPDLFVQDFSPEKGLIGTPRQVFSAPGATQGSPSFSPDGKKLAFVSNKDGTPRIYILDIPAPGAPVKNLKPRMITKKTKDNTCPAWSPDGKKIAYCAQASGVRQIWVYDLTSGEEVQLTEGNVHKENPAWAPNSLHLMFNASTADTSDLYMINLNQRKGVKITSGPGEKRFPAWEPKKT